MHIYDYSFLKKEIPGNIVGLTGVIADLKSKEIFRKLQYEETFNSLQKKTKLKISIDKYGRITAEGKATNRDDRKLLKVDHNKV